MARFKQGKLGQKMAEFLELPLDTMVDCPKLVINGNQQVVVENHRGVIEYERNLVRINTKLGELKITGSELTLVSAVKEELVIEGKIRLVEMVDWR